MEAIFTRQLWTFPYYGPIGANLGKEFSAQCGGDPDRHQVVSK